MRRKKKVLRSRNQHKKKVVLWWCITHILKLRVVFFFLLLLSFNGSPNSKLSRFFFVSRYYSCSSSTSSRVCFVCSVYFHSTNSWDCFFPTPYDAGKTFSVVVVDKKRLFYHHQQQRKTLELRLCVSKMVGADIHHHVTSSLFILTALVFLLLLFAFMCRFKRENSLSHQHQLKNDISGWQQKNSRAKNHYFTSRSSTFFFLCSVRCLSCMYLSYRYIIFGQIHLTNVYACAYQWTSFLLLLVIENS